MGSTADPVQDLRQITVSWPSFVVLSLALFLSFSLCVIGVTVKKVSKALNTLSA